jgi:spore coat protein U-like protein
MSRSTVAALRVVLLGVRQQAVVWAGLSGLGSAAATAATCAFGLVSVVFGNYDTLTNTSLDGTGSITVTCDTTDSYTVALSSGHGTLLDRQMQVGSNVLHYNLYSDTLRSLIWGDGTSGTSLVSGSATSATYSVYGLIPGGQRIPAGTYADAITVTLSF